MSTLGLKSISRIVHFDVVDTPANRKRAYQLLERFATEWVEAFPLSDDARVKAEVLEKGVRTS